MRSKHNILLTELKKVDKLKVVKVETFTKNFKVIIPGSYCNY